MLMVVLVDSFRAYFGMDRMESGGILLLVFVAMPACIFQDVLEIICRLKEIKR